MKSFLSLLDGTVTRIVTLWTLLGLISPYLIFTFHKKYYVLAGFGVACFVIIIIDIASRYNRFKKRVDFIQKKMFFYEKSLGLSQKGASINSDKNVWKKRNTVFWPVLPSKDINLVHVAFINTLKILLTNGFNVHVLVYDMYYIKRMKSEKGFDNDRALRENIKDFKKFLKSNGIKSSMFNGKVTYIKESSAATGKYYKNYSAVCSRLRLPDLRSILASKDTDKNTLLRLLKPISIVAFMATLEQRLFNKTVALTLSGYDEEILYSKCKNTIENLYDGFVPFQLFIPIFSGFSSRNQPGVIDSRYRLTNDNIDNLIELAEGHSYSSTNQEDPLNFIINMLIFAHGENAMKCAQNKAGKGQIAELKRVCSGDCETFKACVMRNALTLNAAA